MKKFYLLILMIIVISPALTFAQTPKLIADFNSGTDDGFNKYNFKGIAIGNNLIFPLVSNEFGEELGILKDNTLSILKDLNPGEKSSEPDNFVLFNNKIYFSAYDETNGGCIWTTDGTTDNTQILFSFEQSSEKPKGLTISESGWLYYTCNDTLYRTDGSSNEELFSGVDFEIDYTHQSYCFSKYKNEIAFLVKYYNYIELYSINEGQASLLAKLEGTSNFSKVFGLSKVSNGLIFGIEDSYKSSNTGTYSYSSDNNSITKITIASSYAKRLHDFSDDFSLALVKGQGFYLTNGEQGEERLLLQSSEANLVQGNGITNSIYNGKMIFHSSEGTWGDDYIIYTDGTSAGTSKLFEVIQYISNIFIKNDNAFVASGTSNGYKPKLYRINMTDGSFENFYNFTEQSLSAESILFLGLLNNKLYFISNLDQTVGRELYSIEVDISSSSESVKNQSNEINLFPNPLSNVLNIKSNEEILQVTVVSSTGATIIQKTTYDNEVQLDMQDVPPGTYFINIVTNNTSTTKTIVKK